MQQQLRTLHSAQSEGAEGTAALLHSELTDAKNQNTVLMGKLKKAQISNQVLEQQCAKQACSHRRR